MWRTVRFDFFPRTVPSLICIHKILTYPYSGNILKFLQMFETFIEIYATMYHIVAFSLKPIAQLFLSSFVPAIYIQEMTKLSLNPASHFMGKHPLCEYANLISWASWSMVHMAWHMAIMWSPLCNSQQENSISDHKYDKSEWDMQKSNPTKSQKSSQHKRYIVPQRKICWAEQK